MTQSTGHRGAGDGPTGEPVAIGNVVDVSIRRAKRAWPPVDEGRPCLP